MLVLVLGATLTFSSCSNEDNDNATSGTMSGMWKSYYDNVIEFSAGNTVYSYGGVTRDRNAWSGKSTESVPGHNGWYYLPSNKRTYTYLKEGNKIYITSGDILTYEGGRLLIDGTNDSYSPW